MREIRQSGSAGGETQINEPSLPLSTSKVTVLIPAKGLSVAKILVPFHSNYGCIRRSPSSTVTNGV